MRRLRHPVFGTAWQPNGSSEAPISKVARVFRVRSEGLGLRAIARCFDIHKNTVAERASRFIVEQRCGEKDGERRYGNCDGSSMGDWVIFVCYWIDQACVRSD